MASNVVISRLPEFRMTRMPAARAKISLFLNVYKLIMLPIELRDETCYNLSTQLKIVRCEKRIPLK